MEFIQNELKEIKELLKKQTIQQKERLTLEEATEYLQLSRSCLYKMTSKREIPVYSPGGKKIYFKRIELDAWVFKSRIAPVSEFEDEVEDYLSKASKNLTS
jgi:excisionase family DNA binding protein